MAISGTARIFGARCEQPQQHSGVYCGSTTPPLSYANGGYHYNIRMIRMACRLAANTESSKKRGKHKMEQHEEDVEGG